jgi:heme-degrading monooxygenase HmoA
MAVGRVSLQPQGVNMIARIWKGVTPESKADRYLEYLMTTGVKELRATEGNRGVYVLRRIDHGQAEFTFISLWESWEAIRRFAGDDVERAVYYPEDKDYLLSLDPKVMHYEVLVAPDKI